MPYIITTNGNEPVAVATLEEAQDIAYERVGDAWTGLPLDAGWSERQFDVDGLDKQGGTVGPLPYGSVIDVRRVPLWELWQDVRPDPPADSPLPPTEAIVAAYNAR